MATYSYVKTDGSTGYTSTPTMAGSPGIDPHSGWQADASTPTSSGATTTVTSSTLTPKPSYPVSTPTYPRSPDISSLNETFTPLEATPQEQKASEISTRIQSLNDTLAGKTAYQQEQDQANGVTEIQKAINDNGTAITQLQKEAEAAKLNESNRQAPMFAIAGSQGAIDRSTAVKALTLSAISDSLNNNLVSAKLKSQQAVDAKFGPVEAELKAKMDNLSLILNDPATTLQDKNRALEQKVLLDNQATAIKTARDNADSVFKVMAAAAQNGSSFVPSSEYPTLSSALAAISSAPTPQEAIQIASQVGIADKTTATSGGTPIGKGTPTGFTQADVRTGDQILRTGVDASGAKIGNAEGPDGHIDPAVYVALFQHWIQSGGTKDAFFTYYPVDRYINPANTWVWSQLDIPNPFIKTTRSVR